MVARLYEATRDFPQEYRQGKRRWHYHLVRLDHDDYRMLKAIAKRRSTTVAELIRTYWRGDWKMTTARVVPTIFEG